MSLRHKMLKALNKVLPSVSQAELEALEAGTVGWDSELLSGRPQWNKLFELNKPTLTEEEQAFLDGPTEQLCKMLDNWQTQQDGDMPREVWDFIKKEGFMGLVISKDYGGKGFSAQAHSAIVMKIASHNAGAAVNVMVPNSLGPAELLHHYGTKEQKDHYLPRLAKGDEIPCFALTGPEAGSDAASIPDTGVVFKDNDGDIKIKLNWEKRYITLGPVATLVGLAFKLEDPDNLLGKGTEPGITVALIPRETPGIEIGNRHRPMNLPFQNGPNKGKDVVIPTSYIIGGQEQAGQGWRMLMECLSIGRSVSLPAMGVAASRFSARMTSAYSRVRRQFGLPIEKFEGIEEVLARMAGKTHMLDAARELTLQMLDQGQKPTVPSAIIKYHLTENMRGLVNDAMDVHGGKAICQGPQNIMAPVYNAIPIGITVEGANIMTRNLIIFGQGGVRAHPYILKELQAVREGLKEGATKEEINAAFSKTVKLFAKHIGYTISNTMRGMWHGLTGSVFSRTPDGVDAATRKYYKQLKRLSAAFNVASEMTLGTLGGDLKRKERTSARLGDVFSNLYMASAVLWQHEKRGQPKEQLPLVDWAMTHSLQQAEESLHKMLDNHPRKTLGKIFKFALFPRGRLHKTPSDKMDRKAADVLREPSETRDQLTRDLFLPKDTSNPVGAVEAAFLQAVKTDPIEKKIAIAVKDGKLEKTKDRKKILSTAVEQKIITADERQALEEMDVLRRMVIMVDDFPQQHPAPAQKPKAERAA